MHVSHGDPKKPGSRYSCTLGLGASVEYGVSKRREQHEKRKTGRSSPSPSARDVVGATLALIELSSRCASPHLRSGGGVSEVEKG